MTLSHLVRPSWPHLVPRLQLSASRPEGPDTCAKYRRAVHWAGIVLPAALLDVPAAAESVRRQRVPIEVRSGTELALAVSVGISPSRIVMHQDGVDAGPLRCAVNARVGQFVVDNRRQVAVVEQWARQAQRILIDVTMPPDDGLVAAALASDRIDLIGLYRRVDGVAGYAGAVDDMVALMAAARRESSVICTRLHLTADGEPREVGRAIEEALDESCARYRFPRPAVALSLRGPGLRFW